MTRTDLCSLLAVTGMLLLTALAAWNPPVQFGEDARALENPLTIFAGSVTLYLTFLAYAFSDPRRQSKRTNKDQ